MGDERTAPPGSRHAGFWLALLLLVAVLSLFFYKAALPGQTLFSNDGPLGRLMSDCRRTPGTLTGGWQDLNSVGYHEGEAGVGPTFALLWLLGPVGFSKFYAPLSLLFLGMAAWCFLRQIGLGRMACILGGLATALNSGYFSTACWGMAAHPIALGMMFLALAALAKTAGGRGWLRAMVAGLAVGMGVADGTDLAAILSTIAPHIYRRPRG